MVKSTYLAAEPTLLRRHDGPLPFDVFVRLGESKHTRIFKRGDLIDQMRLNSYIKKGAQNFYFREKDRHGYLELESSYLEICRQNRAFADEEVQQILIATAEHTLTTISENVRVDETTLRAATTVVACHVEIATYLPELLPAIIRLARKRPTAIRHAILISLFSILLARAKAPSDWQFQTVCGFAGLLHDIGFAELDPSLDEHSPNPTPAELQALRKHPMLGSQILQEVPSLPTGVRTAILQHHEAVDGSGYPMGLKGDAISPAARVIAIADDFVALTTGTNHTPPLHVEVAVHAMVNDKRLDSNLLTAFTQMLRVA